MRTCMTAIVRGAVPVLIVAVVAVVDGALLGGVAAIITSIGGILLGVLSYQRGKAAAPIADDRLTAELERSLEHERDENRALRAELRAQRGATGK